jgi:cellulose biosynthesis protein BcsQ
MNVFATYNIKGGVGKTTSCVTLAWLAAREGRRTLLWDLDPQGAASFYLRIKAKVKGGAKSLLRKERGLDEVIKGTDYPNLHLIPADFRYRQMDLLLDESKKPARRVERLLRPLRKEYDLAFLDCPPSVSLLSESVFGAADALIVQMIPTTLSVRTLVQLRKFCAEQGFDEKRIWPFFTMVDRRKRLHNEIMNALPEHFPNVLQTYVSYASDVERMGIHRKPVTEFAPRSAPALAYESLWSELSERIQKGL